MGAGLPGKVGREPSVPPGRGSGDTSSCPRRPPGPWQGKAAPQGSRGRLPAQQSTAEHGTAGKGSTARAAVPAPARATGLAPLENSLCIAPRLLLTSGQRWGVRVATQTRGDTARTEAAAPEAPQQKPGGARTRQPILLGEQHGNGHGKQSRDWKGLLSTVRKCHKPNINKWNFGPWYLLHRAAKLMLPRTSAGPRPHCC